MSNSEYKAITPTNNYTTIFNYKLALIRSSKAKPKFVHPLLHLYLANLQLNKYLPKINSIIWVLLIISVFCFMFPNNRIKNIRIYFSSSIKHRSHHKLT